jgi:hypothetical protein
MKPTPAPATSVRRLEVATGCGLPAIMVRSIGTRTTVPGGMKGVYAARLRPATSGQRRDRPDDELDPSFIRLVGAAAGLGVG